MMVMRLDDIGIPLVAEGGVTVNFSPIRLHGADMTRSQYGIRIAAAAVLALGSAADACAQGAAWMPNRPVEMLVGVSPGGGIDRTARTLQKIMQDGHFVATPVNVVNKPGGGSTIVQAYLNQHAGDAHY